ncbi:MAG: hypothetical protein AB1432_05470 [Bacteroidota bacterium]
MIQLVSDLSTNMGDSAGSISAFGAAAKGIGTPLIIIMTMLKQIGNLLGTVGAGLAHLFTSNFNVAAKTVSMGWDLMLKDSESMNTALYNMWSDTSKKLNQLDVTPGKTSSTGDNSGNSGTSISIDKLKQEAKLYEELYYGSLKWYNKSVELIKAQTKELISNGIKKADALAYEKKKLDELNASYERMKITFEFLSKLDYKPKFQIPKRLQDIDSAEKPETNQSKLQPYYDLLNEGGPFSNEGGFVNVVETSMSTASGFVDGFFEDIYIKSEQANSMLEKGFVGMANAFISQVQRMISEWLAFQALKAAFAFLGLPIPGAAEGGTYIGTNRGVKRLASGGSFIVPPGFPNDNYPMFVQSGEKVSVTPANRVGEQERLLGRLINQINILNYNILDNSLRDKKQRLDVGVYGKLENDGIYIATKNGEKFRRAFS